MVGGKKLYGRIDQVSKQFHVATLFYHLMWFPLIPIQTYIVIDNAEEMTHFYGIKIPMSMKSVFVAYIRSVVIIIAFITLIRGIILFFGNPPEEKPDLLGSIIRITISTFSFLAYWLSYVWLQADSKREQELRQYIESKQETT